MYTWVRKYEIKVDPETLNEVDASFGSGGLLDAISRMCDAGDTSGAIYLYEDEHGQFWDDGQYAHDPHLSDKGTTLLFGPIPYKVEETERGPDV